VIRMGKLKHLSLLKTSQCMDYINKGDTTANSYSISPRIWKQTKILFIHPLDLTILNSYIILSSCGSKMDHRKFHLAMVQNLLEMSARKLLLLSSQEEDQTYNKPVK